MKRLFIIGNGIVNTDISKKIEPYDVIVRFNDLDNYNLNTGTKTSIWVLSSNKVLLKRLIQNPQKITERTKRTLRDSLLSSQKIIFSIPTFYPLKSKLEIQNNRKERHNSVKNFLSQIGLSGIFYDIIEYPNKYLLDLQPDKWLPKHQCPSNGYLITRLFNEAPEYSNYDVKLVGFSWEGWEGHPWKFEKEYLRKMHSKKLLEIIE